MSFLTCRRWDCANCGWESSCCSCSSCCDSCSWRIWNIDFSLLVVPTWYGLILLEEKPSFWMQVTPATSAMPQERSAVWGQCRRCNSSPLHLRHNLKADFSFSQTWGRWRHILCPLPLRQSVSWCEPRPDCSQMSWEWLRILVDFLTCTQLALPYGPRRYRRQAWPSEGWVKSTMDVSKMSPFSTKGWDFLNLSNKNAFGYGL